MKELVLVCCSGGMDSSTTLAILKLAEYENIRAVHFKYGHRGEDCEELAITNVCNAMNVPLTIFDISDNYKAMGVEEISMLANKNAKIITGTEAGLKTTAAWHPARNLLFMNYMIALAESEIMRNHYDVVYLTGGFFQLSESGCFVPTDEHTITTADNMQVQPLSVKVGDKILSFNFDKKEFEPSEVKHVYKSEHDVTYKVTISDNSPIYSTRTLLLSKEHPFWIKDKGWVETKDLQINDVCYGLESSRTYECVIDRIEKIDGKQEMWNFHCEPNNNFFLNGILTHNTYPDNTSYFVDACLDAAKYGTLIGNRLKPLYCCCNLMKSEQYALIDHFHLYHIYKNTISCDRPKLIERGGVLTPCNCSKNGMPACGSGLLSYWAGKMVGINDMQERNFYEIEEDYTAYKPPHLNTAQRTFDIEKIIDRIKLPQERLNILKSKM